MYSRRTKSSTLAAAAVILLMSFTSLKVRGEDPRRNDGRVERLRAKFSAAGVETPPAPPADLGVHTACVKFGLACPDPYVKFLAEELAKLQGHAGGASHGKDEEEEVPTPMAPPPGARKAPKPPVRDNDPTHDAKLERLRRLRNVYRDKLLALHTTQTYWGCLLPHIKTITHRVFLLYIATVMQLLCSPLTLHIFFAAIIMTVLTWILFGTHIPNEHMCCIRATKPVFAMEGLLRSWGPPKSVANLVIERELCSIWGDAEWIDGTSTGNAPDKEASWFRRWAPK
uniref:Uncharacterized protein TCIL3000_3_2450 n=1 Tax=Trypanosoma congolense (strain IL3000) TaxID=1068625 RepID=G0UKA7_TRYCI|nr:unnamed protein product [Trypanosoma congolense IL3000]